MTLEPGYLLNKRYRIVEILGQGGMAAVYRAIDDNLGVEVAVKENLFTTEEYARQFRREAVILANLRHSNLPRVTDHFVIEQQGQYLVMDYIEGEDLRQRIDRLGPLDGEEVIILGAAICDALAYMHTCRPPVLHRDIKPGNVKITPEGQIFLVDFGLAKVLQGSMETTTGARAMTPGYSPPEQYGTAHTDNRTDIYSLGATLYSALTDTIPEDGLARAMDQATMTPLRKHDPNIPRRLASVIEKSLAVLPDDRYQTAEEFEQDLLNARNTTQRRIPIDTTLPPPPPVLEGEVVDTALETAGEAFQMGDDAALSSNQAYLPVPVNTPVIDVSFKPPSYRRRKRLRIWLVVAILLAIIATGAAAYGMSSASPAIPLPRHSPTATATIIPTQSRLPTETRLPVIVNEATPTHTPTLIPSSIPSHTPTPTITLTPTSSATPFGGGLGQIAFASDRSGAPEIWLMAVDGTGLSQLTQISEGACQPSWSPDGKRLVFISPCPKNTDIYRGASLFVINADGANMVPLPSAPGGDFNPTWSPDGKRIAFTSLRDHFQPQIFIINLEDDTVTMMPDLGLKPNAQPVWSPDGKEIAFIRAYDQIWAMSDTGTNRHMVTYGVNFQSSYPKWSPDGKVILFTQYEFGVSGSPWLAVVQYAKQGNVPIIIAHDAPMSEADYSPDGYWLVFQSWPDRGYHHLYIMTPNGVYRQQITNGSYNDFDPVWRPAPIIP
jgi:serine/threonine protein kinase